MALWTWADDEGRGRLIPKEVEGYAFPNDNLREWGTSIEKLIAELVKAGRIVAYEHQGERYFTIPTFRKHQKPRKPTPSRIPTPPLKALGPARRAPTADEYVFHVLEHHFGKATAPATREKYVNFIVGTLAQSGYHDDTVGAKETERRIINMKAAHADNIRAWTLNNLINNWDHWGVDRRPVTKGELTRATVQHKTREALDG